MQSRTLSQRLHHSPPTLLISSGWFPGCWSWTLAHIQKQRHYFANKGPSSQGYGFSSSHVWMWELNYKESWALKNWCFWTVVFEKTLESPLDCKEIQPVHSKVPESSSNSQGISLKVWAVSVEIDSASDSRYRTACLFQASGLLLYFDKSIRSEIWHFQFPLTQIYCLIFPFKQSSCFSDSLRIMFTCDYIVTHAYVWAAYHIPQFISYLSKSCFPLVS